MSYDDEALEKLLANGHLSGASYDRIEERVLARTARPSPRKFGRAAALAGTLAAAAILVLLVGRAGPEDGTAGFTEKGAPEPQAGSIELSCSPEGRPCRPGDTLMFVVDRSVHSGYLSATAERWDEPGRGRVQLFPSKSGDMPHVANGEGMAVASRGVRLTGALTPGTYRVLVWFSRDRPDVRPEVPEGAFSLRLVIAE